MVQEPRRAFIENMIALENEGYHNDLKPFDQHAAEIVMEANAYFTTLDEKLNEAKLLLKRHLTLEEQQDPHIAPDATIEAFENCLHTMDEKFQNPGYSFLNDSKGRSMQETFGISWAFMDRAFLLGKRLLREKQYHDAQMIFFLLRYLSPMVAEYWFCEGLTEQLQNEFQDASAHLAIASGLQPNNPLFLYQLGSCLLQMGNDEAGHEMLMLALQQASEQAIDRPYVQQITKLLAA